MSTTASYLKTLRRIPDDIVLSMATREIVPADPYTCICGWAIREDLARAAGSDADAEDVETFDVVTQCCDRFGGSEIEWFDLFDDIVARETPAIELAFVTRVMEAAGVEVAR